MKKFIGNSFFYIFARMEKLFEKLLFIVLFFSSSSLKGQVDGSDAHVHLRDSLAKATEMLAYNPDSIGLRLKKVAWNIELEQWDYAKDDLDKVLFLNPTNVAGLFYRAFVNEKLHRFKFARLDYTNLLTLVPGNLEAQLGLALLNQKDGRLTEAYDGINSLVEQFPDSAIVYAARAGIEKERNMPELAEYDFSKALELDTDNVDYLLNHCDLLILLGRKESALSDINRLVALGVSRSSLRSLLDRIKSLK
ncbi:hypothetical protein KZY59_00310 [Prevotella buccae]|uniref:tetratricopeptide repeat protein n=1 Tax=Segatella buccae TaxID=28126 RepID=UPI001C5F4796|nr:hypothetical protein [Segatella buccae]MBW4869996.1 hypothetical protein [Segatella buccae]